MHLSYTSGIINGNVIDENQLNTPSKAISIDVFPDPLQMITTGYNHTVVNLKIEDSRRSDDQVDTITFEQLLATDMEPECPLGWRRRTITIGRFNRPGECGVVKSNVITLSCRWNITLRRLVCERV